MTATTTHQAQPLTFEPDLADRLSYIWSWLIAKDQATDERRAARATIWLTRHQLRLYRDAA